jgi:hypothetical protein
MLRWHRALAIALVLVLSGTGAAGAQTPGTQAGDPALRRAQQLASDGNASMGRALLDSVLAASPEGSPLFVDALFWRATMAESPERARGDYLRITVEFSLSPRAEDALLRLAQLELARGDRAAAKKHLERLALEHATGPSRTAGLYWMGRILLEEGAMAKGCSSLKEAGSRVSSQDVELANQIGYYARPCVTVQRAVDSARVDSVARADSLARADFVGRGDSASRKGRSIARSTVVKSERPAAKGEAAGRPTWSVQVAAYSTRDAAEQLARRLAARGFGARVTAERPFRVRIGRFSKREDAVRLAATLKAVHSQAIIVEAEQP